MNKKLHFKVNILIFTKIVLLAIGMQPFSSPTFAGRTFEMSDLYYFSVTDGEVTLKLTNATIKTILYEIQKQTKINFVYKESDFKNFPTKSIDVKSSTVKKILETLFAETEFAYNINGNNISITKGSLKSTQQSSKKTFLVKGRLTDKNKLPVTGATLLIKGTTKGAISNDNGQFSFVGNLGDVIEISCIGMKTITKTISNENELTIVLEDDALAVEDVVVTGIFEKSKESYTGAVTVITEKELKSFGNRNIIATIGNIDPSFNVMRNNEWGSNPNRLPEIQMRGAASLPNVKDLRNDVKTDLNTPLIILDGFEITLQRMMDMDDSEIASITLLKDGSATAIYGSRGANGVVVITTKKPESGKLTISYNAGIDIEMPDLTGYNLLNAKDKLDLEYKAGYYNTPRAEQDIILKKRYNALLADIERGVDTYWLSQPLRTGIGQRHNFRVQGGDSRFRYSASIQYRVTSGVMKGSDRENLNGSINLSYNYKNITFNNTLSVGINNSSDSPYGTFATYTEMNPYWAPYDNNGKLIKTYDKSTVFYGKIPKNPMYNATLNNVKTKDYIDLTNNLNVEWKPIKELSLRGRLGLTKGVNNSDTFKPADHTDFSNYSNDDVFRKGSYNYSSGKAFRYDMSITANFIKTFNEKHNLTIGLNCDLSENNTSNYGFLVEGFVHEKIDFLSAALQYQKDGKPTGSESMSRRIGFVGNINYSFANRFFIDGSFRKDGSSQFGSNKRYGTFFSGGIGWNIHNEEFMKSLEKVFNKLKIRGSYGKTGSQQFSSYQGQETYKYYTDDRYYHWMGAFQSELGNDNLEWQSTDKYNVGLEMSFLNNRLSTNIELYYEKTGNLLSSLEIPYSNGFTSYSENIGAVENKGYELRLTGYLIRDTKRNITWTITTNLVSNNDKIVKLSEVMKLENERLSNVGGSTPNKILREGDSQNTIYVVPSLGIDPSTGKELYIKKNGTVTYDWFAGDRVACGQSEPKYRGNFSTMFRYRNLSLNLSFGYVFGGQLYNQTLINKVENANMKFNVDQRVYSDRWVKPGDKASYKGLKNLIETQNSSRFVEDESTLTCQSAYLTYDWRTEWLKRNLRITSLSFTASLNESFQWSTVHRERGLSYPFSRSLSLGLAVIF